MVLTTVVRFDAEVLDEGEAASRGDDVASTLTAAIEDGAGVATDDGVLTARFGDPAAAVEAAVVGQWNVQKLGSVGLKLRVGIHTDDDPATAAVGAEALADIANGNQILASGAVDVATGGMLDARPMGTVRLAGAEPVQIWLMTDSRPDVDRRPLILPE